MGKIGVRSSGPAGSLVPGLRGGSGAPGRSGSRLIQWVGMSRSFSRNFTGSSLMSATYPTRVTTVSDPELQAVAWDLEELVDGDGSVGVERLLDEATRVADAFADAYAGRIDALDGPGLVAAMEELAAV